MRRLRDEWEDEVTHNDIRSPSHVKPRKNSNDLDLIVMRDSKQKSTLIDLPGSHKSNCLVRE